MRVIAGKYRRLLLKAPKGHNTRPSLDQVKEAIFSIIGDKVFDAKCLDLFAGSGALGIEALSRGASFVHFNDKSYESIKVIKENIAHCKIKEPYQITKMDYKRLLSTIDTKFDLVFLDPPYKEGVINEVITTLEKRNLLNEKAVIVCETDLKPPLLNVKDYQIKEYYYGRVCLTILKRIE